MIEITYDVIVVGAGPAGLAAAAEAKKSGAEWVAVIERDNQPGGILQQCIHPGFGLEYFREELTGPEYAQRFIEAARREKVEFYFNTMALDFDASDNTLVCSCSKGLYRMKAGSFVLAMGCRERTRANLVIPGSRPAGIYTAGTAQRLLNVQGYNVGKNIIILGSGDIGMIMARRMTLEGATVKAVVEIMPFLAGLKRNKVQCLDDFHIPLFLSHTIVDITGVDRVESVTVAPVNENREPVLEKSEVIPCDTVLFSVGLIPENELTQTADLTLNSVTRGVSVNQFMQTENPSIFACGNVLHVNDLVDHVTREGEIAGFYAARHAKGELKNSAAISAHAGANVRYVCPQKIALIEEQMENVTLFFRVLRPQKNVEIVVLGDGEVIHRKKTLSVNPGEIESVEISNSLIEGLTDKVTVEIR